MLPLCVEVVEPLCVEVVVPLCVEVVVPLCVDVVVPVCSEDSSAVDSASPFDCVFALPVLVAEVMSPPIAAE